MPKKTKELSAAEVRRLSGDGLFPVGGVAGLCLQVRGGGRSWILRVMGSGRRRHIGLGPYPEVSLAMARLTAAEAMDKVRRGVDIVAERRAIRAGQRPVMTFQEAAAACLEKKRPEFRSEKHAHDWLKSVELHALPVIGRLPVGDVTTEHILEVLRPLWEVKTETATRLRQRLEAILTWAIISGYRSGENVARWSGHLEALLPSPAKIRKVRHMPALPYNEIGQFMERLRDKGGQPARCLEFVILTACRSGEARGARWSEVIGDTWTIPSERTKTGRSHTVPLSKAALELLEQLPRFEGSELIFPSRKNSPLSDMALLKVCRDMQAPVVPHGMRSTFRDWCAESTSYPGEVAEQALGHSIKNRTEAAYRRGDLLEKRRQLMALWSEFVGQVQAVGGDVVPIRHKKL